ncbi:hypothetical protein Q6249_28275, partial [Klebsiella pneumoniae]|uniref:hypothetical protein n=1 Tax=Klebsiella pneumoniae TaxID=573 RepID=UPI0027317D9B
TSWKNIDDPSPGELTLGLDKPQLPQLLLKRNSIKLSRWGPWEGVRFSGSDIFGTDRLFSPIFKTNYFTFTVLGEALVRLQVNQIGKIQV